MNISETLNDGLKRGYKIFVTAAELDEKVDVKLKEAQPKVELKGFRKGKVPLAMLKKQFGKSILGEAMQEAIDGAMSQHFEESGDKPAVQPEVKMLNEDWKEGDDIEVALNYERLPEIPEVSLEKLKIQKLLVKAGDAEIKEALDNLAQNAQDFTAKKGKAANGDQVILDFVGKIGGEAFEGGAAEGHALTLGSQSFIPGFEDQLVGAKAGDAVDVKVTFPEEYQAEALAGKDATFECQVHEVKKPVAPKIDDDFAKKFGSDTLDALKTQISERIEGEYSAAARLVMKRNLMDQLDKLVSFELPQALIDTEAKQIAHQLWREENPDAEPKEGEPITPSDEHISLAQRRVKLGLFLAELGNQKSIEVTDAELQQQIMQEARRFPGQERAYFDFVKNNPQMQQQLQAPIFEDKVVDSILEGVEVKEKKVTKAALEKEVEALEE